MQLFDSYNFLIHIIPYDQLAQYFQVKKKQRYFSFSFYFFFFISFTNLMFSIALQMSFVVCFSCFSMIRLNMKNKNTTKFEQSDTISPVAHCWWISQVVKLIANAKKFVLIMTHLECGTHVRPTPKWTHKKNTQNNKTTMNQR